MAMNRKLKFNLKTNSIVCGDCEEWLKFIPNNSMDLIYIDPPFFSNKNYEIVWGNGFEFRSFGDRWAGGIRHYIEWMRPKIREAKKKLKDTGSILVHCDWHANHRIRCLLDDEFGEKNFVNEIIWSYRTGGGSKKRFGRKHDNIYLYSKSKKYKFNQLKEKSFLAETWAEPETPTGLKWGIKREEKCSLCDKENGSKYRIVGHRDIIDVDFSTVHPDRIGYITQKPEELLNKLITALSNENDIVLDFFGGGGTTASVCSKLNRRFIIGDVSPVAVRVTADRLISQGYIGYDVKALPHTKEEYLLMRGHKFADMICEFMGWESNPRKSGDGGIDGWTNRGNTPIQIKNHRNKVGRPDIQKFLGAITDYDSGIFVAWKFSQSAHEYRAKIKDRNIVFKEVEDILGSLLLPLERRKKQQQLYDIRVKKRSCNLQDIKKDRIKSSI